MDEENSFDHEYCSFQLEDNFDPNIDIKQECADYFMREDNDQNLDYNPYQEFEHSENEDFEHRNSDIRRDNLDNVEKAKCNLLFNKLFGNSQENVHSIFERENDNEQEEDVADFFKKGLKRKDSSENQSIKEVNKIPTFTPSNSSQNGNSDDIKNEGCSDRDLQK